MQAPPRARVRPHRRLATIIATLIAAGGAQCALVSTAGAGTTSRQAGASAAASGADRSTATKGAPSARDTQTEQRGTATVTVAIKGLPRNVRGNVKLTGPGKKSRRITTTTKLTGISPGAYTVSAQPIIWHASTYRPTLALCSASGRCSSLSHRRITVKAHQRVTIAVTYAAAAPPNSANPSPVGSTQGPPERTLAPGASESGGWSASIQVPAGGPQAQADGVVSFPIALNEIPDKNHAKYLNEKEVAEPGSVPGCNGSANAPLAEPGYLCVYLGATAIQGSLESEWKNAGFYALEDFAGNIKGGKLGELVVFRTTTFSEVPTTIPAAASLTAAGSWSVTERR